MKKNELLTAIAEIEAKENKQQEDMDKLSSLKKELEALEYELKYGM